MTQETVPLNFFEVQKLAEEHGLVKPLFRKPTSCPYCELPYMTASIYLENKGYVRILLMCGFCSLYADGAFNIEQGLIYREENIKNEVYLHYAKYLMREAEETAKLRWGPNKHFREIYKTKIKKALELMKHESK